MAELKRKEDQLTTADLAGKTTENRAEHEMHDPTKPKLVRSETGDIRERERDAHERERSASQPNAPRAELREVSAPLFSDSDVTDLRGRWSNVQTGFVDEPRRAVEEADKLVAAVMKRLAEGFANERSGLEKQWARGDNVSTEDLRVALQRYRSFFDRLLNA
ncbi:MAG TPA: hypothetical protein VFU86_23855 [Terriglobales bacterium]|nr:hypothetical protein [Terriglobales bacterium]